MTGYMTPLTPSRFLAALVAVFIVTLLGDMLWHNWLLMDFYYTRLSAINGAPMPATFPVSLLIAEAIAAAGTVYFVLSAPKAPTLSAGACRGALIGLMLGGALNLVNHSLIALWDLNVVLVDICWATALGAIGGAVTVWAAGWAGKRWR
jgi:uncharacterized membrane protein